MVEKSSTVHRVGHFNIVARVPAYVSTSVQCGDQSPGRASPAATPVKHSSRLQQRMRRKSSKTGKENHQRKLRKNRKKRKHAKSKDDSQSAKLAYSRRDGGVQPDDVMDDIPSEHLQRLKIEYYHAHVVVDEKTAHEIEQSKREQSRATSNTGTGEQLWYAERQK